MPTTPRLQQPLTPDQQEIVANNRGLIGHCIKRIAPYAQQDLHEELWDEGTDALIACARGFDPERGVKFSTYACRAIINRFTRHFARRGRRIKFVGVGSPEKDGYLANGIGTRHDFGDADDRDEVAKLLRSLTPSERAIIELRFLAPETATMQQVAALMGVSRQRIQQVQARALIKCRERAEVLGIS